MIIWIRNRKGWVGGVFFVLAGIFALSFVIGGVGTGNNASLSDIFGNNGGGSGTTTAQPASVGSLEKKVKAQPKNAQAWQDLAERLRQRDPPDRRGARLAATSSRSSPATWTACSASPWRRRRWRPTTATRRSSCSSRRSPPRPATTARSRAARSARSPRIRSRRPRPRPQTEQQTKLLDRGEQDRQEGEHLVEALDEHLRQDRRAAGVHEERPRRHDLAQLRLRRAERERHEDGDQGLRRLPQARARRRQRAAGQDDPEAAQGRPPSSTTTTTP